MKFCQSQFLRAATWPDLVHAVNQQTPHEKWIFRGLRKGPDGDNDVKLLSHFDEAWTRKKWPPSMSEDRSLRRLYEAWMLREFRREAYHYLRHLPDKADLLEWLALGRHYGMPVRLVDFTYSFYVAAYFAICRVTGEDSGWILAFDHDWHKTQLEEKWVPKLRMQDIPDARAAFQEPFLFRRFAVDNASDYVAAVNPFRRNPRLAAQQGLFLCPANIEHEFDQNFEGALPSDPEFRKERLILIEVPSGMREETLKALRRMNISSASLFRDLSGWAESQGDIVHNDFEDERFKQELELELTEPR